MVRVIFAVKDNHGDVILILTKKRIANLNEAVDTGISLLHFFLLSGKKNANLEAVSLRTVRSISRQKIDFL